MTHQPPDHLPAVPHFEVADIDLDFRRINLDDATPIGRQVLTACGKTPHDQHVVLQWLSDGQIEEISLEERVRSDDVHPIRLILARCDRLFRFILEDRSMAWPERRISEAALRKLGRVDRDKILYQRRETEADVPVFAGSSIDLAEGGTEVVYARAPVWELNVQGVAVTSDRPEITVEKAMRLAGFDVAAAWVIVLKTSAGRQQVDLDFVIDLRLPGIEKLRLTPREINNGEAMAMPPRAFRLLAADEAGLGERGFDWTTSVEQGRRWLILRDVLLPAGFDAGVATIAMEIPPTYPVGEIDMFYVYPHLTRRDGVTIPQTQMAQPIGGLSFQRWSRHRGPGAPWRAGHDSVLTHLTLVDASIAREVEA